MLQHCQTLRVEVLETSSLFNRENCQEVLIQSVTGSTPRERSAILGPLGAICNAQIALSTNKRSNLNWKFGGAARGSTSLTTP